MATVPFKPAMRLYPTPLQGLLAMASLCLIPSCTTGPTAPDPFDVAIGMAAASMMTEQAPSDATMQAFAEAIKPPTVIQQTVVQEAPKSQPGGGQ